VSGLPRLGGVTLGPEQGELKADFCYLGTYLAYNFDRGFLIFQAKHIKQALLF
jgi:hypothetical protein